MRRGPNIHDQRCATIIAIVAKLRPPIAAVARVAALKTQKTQNARASTRKKALASVGKGATSPQKTRKRSSGARASANGRHVAVKIAHHRAPRSANTHARRRAARKKLACCDSIVSKNFGRPAHHELDFCCLASGLSRSFDAHAQLQDGLPPAAFTNRRAPIAVAPSRTSSTTRAHVSGQTKRSPPPPRAADCVQRTASFECACRFLRACCRRRPASLPSPIACAIAVAKRRPLAIGVNTPIITMRALTRIVVVVVVVADDDDAQVDLC